MLAQEFHHQPKEDETQISSAAYTFAQAYLYAVLLKGHTNDSHSPIRE